VLGAGIEDGRRWWHDVPRVTEERERAQGQKIAKCDEREHGA
jgi:hypothetical protein